MTLGKPFFTVLTHRHRGSVSVGLRPGSSGWTPPKEAFMTLTLPTRFTPERSRTVPRGPQRVGGWRERRRAAKEHAQAARTAEAIAILHQVQTLVREAQEVIARGWIQDAWLQYRDDKGQQRLITARTLRRLAGHPVTGACLVGAFVHAGGGPWAIRTQPVQRAVELTWHTLFRPGQPIDWCPPPQVRALRVRELTRWNDDSSRNARQVEGLLVAVEQRATVELAALVR
jgi:hypothetical protein